MSEKLFDGVSPMRNDLVRVSIIDGKFYIRMSPYALNIKEYKALWSRDTSRNKVRSALEMTYVYYMCHYMSPYNSYGDDKESQIIFDLFDGQKWKPDAKVKAAMSKFKELQVTYSMKHLFSVRKALDSLTDYYNSIKFDPMNPGDYDPVKVGKSIEKTDELLANISKLEDRVFKELEDKESGIRGGGGIGLFELPENI